MRLITTWRAYSPCTTRGQRWQHTLQTPAFNVERGAGDFLTPTAAKRIAVEWQSGLLRQLNALTKNTRFERYSVVKTVMESCRLPEDVLIFNYASEALNNSFFLSTLRNEPQSFEERGPLASSQLASSINEQFGSFDAFMVHFAAHVAGLHPSAGAYTWLVTDPDLNLGVISTHAGGTVLIKDRIQMLPASMQFQNVLGEESRSSKSAEPSSPSTSGTRSFSTSAVSLDGTESSVMSHQEVSRNMRHARFMQGISRHSMLHPLVCLSTAQHCYAPEYSLFGRDEYVGRWFAHVDWARVSQTFDQIAPRAAPLYGYR